MINREHGVNIMQEMNKKQKLMIMIRLLNEINEQKDWIYQCGENLLGYLRRYGDAEKDKTGGRAICDADITALRKLQKELDKLNDSLRKGIKVDYWSTRKI